MKKILFAVLLVASGLFSLSAHADDDDLGYGALGFILGASMAPPPVYYAPPPPPPVVVYRAYPRVYWEDDDRDWRNHGWEERRHHWDRH